MTEGKPDEYVDYFRCEVAGGIWTFQVGVVAWPTPHEPALEWRSFRRWMTAPGRTRLARARASAMVNRRFFRECERCHAVCNAGHMHDELTCQTCAERYSTVFH